MMQSDKVKIDVRKPSDCCDDMEAYNKEKCDKDCGFEFTSTGWYINGCCGGHCFVIGPVRYCPFCGSPLDS